MDKGAGGRKAVHSQTISAETDKTTDHRLAFALGRLSELRRSLQLLETDQIDNSLAGLEELLEDELEDRRRLSPREIVGAEGADQQAVEQAVEQLEDGGRA